MLRILCFFGDVTRKTRTRTCQLILRGRRILSNRRKIEVIWTSFTRSLRRSTRKHFSSALNFDRTTPILGPRITCSSEQNPNCTKAETNDPLPGAKTVLWKNYGKGQRRFRFHRQPVDVRQCSFTSLYHSTQPTTIVESN